VQLCDGVSGYFSNEQLNLNSFDLNNENQKFLERNNNTENDLKCSELLTNDLLLLVLKLRHGLSREAIGDLLNFCNSFSDKECVSKSKYLFDKHFQSYITLQFDFYYLCESCNSYTKDVSKTARTHRLQCSNPLCTNDDIKKQSRNTFFIHLPLKEQLIDLLENHDIDGSLINIENRVKNNLDNCEDIFDGELYKSVMQEYDYSRLSLTFNTDGVPVFKSSSCSIWPILCTVNELPPKLRKEHVLLTSLWFGGSKPSMNVFLEPFVEEVRELDRTGFSWTRSKDKVVFTTKVRALIGVCDSVARPTLQGFTQYNGKYGCSFCFDSGVYVEQGAGHTRVYPFEIDSELRTPKLVIELAERAISVNKIVLGVKGPSILSLLPGFDIIQGLVPDYMHSVLLGVVRQLARLWFDSTNSAELFYISTAKQRLIDVALNSIRPPCNISRTPRSISMRKFWKAHEWYMWLLYYSLSVLKSFLPKKFYMHYALLVEGVSILLKDSIAQALLDHSDNVLTQFVIDFQSLYGLNNVSFNVHLCLHLTSSVRAWGPLWAHSAFVFESFNGSLLNMIKGTQAVPIQICKSFALHRSIPKICAAASENCSVTYKELLRSFLSGNSRSQNSMTINGVTVLGTGRLRQLTNAHLIACHYVAKHVPRNTVVRYYNRIIVSGEIIHCSRYCKNLKRNSYTVILDDSSIYAIDVFIVADFGNGTNAYALGHFIECRTTPFCRHPSVTMQLAHLKFVSRELGPLFAIQVQRILHKCIFLNIQNDAQDVVCLQLNLYEYCS